MARSSGGRFAWLGVLGALCGALAAAALTFAVVNIAGPQNDPKVRVNSIPEKVLLPAHETYGFFINDADNSGYSESCDVLDRGRHVPLRDPSWSVSSSEFETLDFVFNTGSGHLTLSCDVPGETVLAKAVPNYVGIAVGLLAGGVLACLGAGLLLAWFLVRRPSKPVSAAGALPAAGN